MHVTSNTDCRRRVRILQWSLRMVLGNLVFCCIEVPGTGMKIYVKQIYFRIFYIDVMEILRDMI